MHDVLKMMLPDVVAQPVGRRRSTRAASDEVPHDELVDLAVPWGSDGALVWRSRIRSRAIWCAVSRAG